MTRLAYCGRSWVGDPNLPGHKPKPSSPDLAFFQNLGPGGENEKSCAICGYHAVAHELINPGTGRPRTQRTAHDFVPRPPLDFDAYYCGCRGWD